MKKLLPFTIMAMLAQTAFADPITYNRNLDDTESSGTILEEGMDEDIQAEEEEAEQVKDERRAKEIQADERRNPTRTRLNRSYQP